MTYQWTENTRPDRPGIWWAKGEPNPFAIRCPEQWNTDTWAFICDLPEIKDPPKYRMPTQADVRRECEFCDEPTFTICVIRRPLLGMRSCDVYKFVPDPDHDFGECFGYRYARILDDGEPAKQPDPELKLGRSYTYDGKKYSLVAWRWDHKQPDEHIGVFEVIDESAS